MSKMPFSKDNSSRMARIRISKSSRVSKTPFSRGSKDSKVVEVMSLNKTTINRITINALSLIHPLRTTPVVTLMLNSLLAEINSLN